MIPQGGVVDNQAQAVPNKELGLWDKVKNWLVLGVIVAALLSAIAFILSFEFAGLRGIRPATIWIGIPSWIAMFLINASNEEPIKDDMPGWE